MTVTKKRFALSDLAKAKTPAQTTEKIPKMSPWGKEFMKRLDKLHKVMHEEGLKFNNS